VTIEPVAPSLRRGGKRTGLDDLAHVVSAQEALALELKPPLGDVEATAEAYRCLECGTDTVPAPCQVVCPAGIDVPAFITAIRRGQRGEAGRLISSPTPWGPVAHGSAPPRNSVNAPAYWSKRDNDPWISGACNVTRPITY